MDRLSLVQDGLLPSLPIPPSVLAVRVQSGPIWNVTRSSFGALHTVSFRVYFRVNNPTHTRSPSPARSALLRCARALFDDSRMMLKKYWHVSVETASFLSSLLEVDKLLSLLEVDNLDSLLIRRSRFPGVCSEACVVMHSVSQLKNTLEGLSGCLSPSKSFVSSTERLFKEERSSAKTDGHSNSPLACPTCVVPSGPRGLTDGTDYCLPSGSVLLLKDGIQGR